MSIESEGLLTCWKWVPVWLWLSLWTWLHVSPLLKMALKLRSLPKMVVAKVAIAKSVRLVHEAATFRGLRSTSTWSGIEGTVQICLVDCRTSCTGSDRMCLDWL